MITGEQSWWRVFPRLGKIGASCFQSLGKSFSASAMLVEVEKMVWMRT
jgi:hypothetical protein